MIRVLVTNSKGGCGKTTIATTLASAFAGSGQRTALAEVDRQRSSLDWLAARPPEAATVLGLDWRKVIGEVPDGIQRLVIDAPANLRMKEVDALIETADAIIVPVQPSVFDEGSTRRFLERLAELKPVRKGRRRLLLVANRVRRNARATRHLEAFLAGLDRPVTARLAERALYAELAARGLAAFDLGGGTTRAAQAEWAPLLQAFAGD